MPTVSFAPYAVPQFFDNAGKPIGGGTLETYLAGTSTPAATYADGAGEVANPIAIALDSAGRPSNGGALIDIRLDAGKNYKFVLKDKTGAIVRTVDNISGKAAALAGGTVASDAISDAPDEQFAIATKIGAAPVVASTPTELIASTRKFPSGSTIQTANGLIYKVASSDATDAHVTTAGGVKLYVVPGPDGYDVRAFGAVGDGATDNTTAIAAADAAGPVHLPDGEWVTARVRTENATGPGILKSYSDTPRYTPPQLRKNAMIANRPRQPFEDEYASHAVVDGVSLDYTAFAGGAMVDGSEIYVCRTAYEHEANHAYPTVLALYRFRKDEVPAWTKHHIYTTTLALDIRDINVAPHPTRPGIALISFSEHLIGNTYQSRLIVWNERTRAMESSRLLGGVAGNQFKWGNALITPLGHLLVTTYALDGTTITVWRSATPLSISDPLAMTPISTVTLPSLNLLSESSMGYWGDMLTMFIRRTYAPSRVTYSYNKEGYGPWAPLVIPDDREAHSPAVIPYNNSPVWTAFFSLGTDRRYNGAVSTTDMRRFKSTLVAPATGLIRGGYPTIMDCGGYYATFSYADIHQKEGEPHRTRIDRIEIDKGRVDITPADAAYTPIITLPTQPPGSVPGLWMGTPYGATALHTGDGRNYSIGFELSADMTVGGVCLVLSGTANVQVELYEGSTLMTTSVAVSLSSPAPVATAFTLNSPMALSSTREYRIKITGNGAVGIYDLRHNNRRPTLVKCGQVKITGLYTPADFNMYTTGLTPIGLRVQL